MKHSYSITGIIFLFSFISLNISANPSNEYHYLSENLVESENYEIKKIINGPIDGVFLVKENNTIIVQADEYLFKINKKGYLIDTLDRPRGIYSSGIYFKEDYFIDWIYSGNKSEQKYSKVINGDTLSATEFRRYLDSAEAVEFSSQNAGGKSTGRIFLIIKNRGFIINTTAHAELINNECTGKFRYLNAFEKIGWNDSCMDGYKKKHTDRIVLLQNSLSPFYKWDNRSSSLYVNEFEKDVLFFEEGFAGWLFTNILGRTILSGLPGSLPASYWYGTGYFQLKHQSETLNFKAFVSSEKEGIKFENLAIHGFPGQYRGGLKIIEITYIPNNRNYSNDHYNLNKYYESDVGLYILRKKKRTGQKIIEGASRKNNQNAVSSAFLTRNSWRPVYSGMKPASSIQGDITFFNKEEETLHYLLDKTAVQTPFHSLPEKITFNWNGKIKSYAFKLFLNNKKFIWLSLPDLNSNISVEINFKESEIRDAFKKLEKTKQPVYLKIQMEAIDKNGADLSIHLGNKKEYILLNETKIQILKSAVKNENKKNTMKFEKGKLRIEYKNALKDTDFIKGFLDVSADIAANSPHAKEYSPEFSFYTLKLIYHSLEKKDYTSAEKITYHYMDKLLPNAGKNENTGNIASIAFFIAINNHNDDLNARIFKDLLGPEFNIKNEKNGVLLFNLACYHAIKKEKKKMLEAVSYALKNGKTSKEFMKDSDFKEYWSDADFLKTLSVGVEKSELRTN